MKLAFMWGATLILLSLSGAPQTVPDPAAPHPATLAPYRPPSVMPYQPPSAFELEALAQGDRLGGRVAPKGLIDVDAAARDYGQAVSERETQADAARGDSEGLWRVVDAAGTELFALSLETRDNITEGGWRRGGHAGAASLDRNRIALDGRGVLALEAGQGDVRRGRLDGRSVNLIRTP